MKKIFVALLGVLVFFISVRCQHNDELLEMAIPQDRAKQNQFMERSITEQIKLVTYNTHLFLITRYEDALRQKAVIAFLKEQADADVFVLTEVWTDASKRAIAQSLSATHPYAIHTEANGIVGDGLLILSKLGVHKKHFERFKDAAGFDALSQKGFWELELGTKKGAGVYLYASHLQADDDQFEVRNKQFSQMLQRMNAKKDYPIIVAGDLNVPAEKREYVNVVERRLGFLQDPAKHPTKKNYTYDEVRNELAQHFDTNKKVVEQSRLDYILVAKEAHVNKDLTKVFTPKYTSKKAGKLLDVSDHYPIQTVVSITTDKTSIPPHLYNTHSEAASAIKALKSAYGNGVSGLTIIENTSNQYLRLKKRIVLDGGEFFSEPPSVIPPGKFGVFLVVHPPGEALGVESSLEYHIGATGHYFSTKSIIPWGWAANEINGKINAVVSDGSGKRFTSTAQGFQLRGVMGGGTSPTVTFTFSNQ